MAHRTNKPQVVHSRMPDVDGEGHHRAMEAMYHGAPCNQYYRPRLTIGDGTARVELDLRAEFLHPARTVHGGVYFKVLDDAAYFAANSLVTDVFLLTESFHTHFLRAVGEGTLVAEGRVVYRSSKHVVAEAVAHDAKGREVARGSGTFLKSNIGLVAEKGYGAGQGTVEG